MRTSLLFPLALLACTGVIDDPAGSEEHGPLTPDPREGPAREILCEGDPVAPPAPLARFGASEYENNLRALFGDAPIDALAEPLAALPKDDPEEEGAFGRQDARLFERHVETWFRIADTLAQRAAADPSILGTDCADAECLARFLLPRAFRRPASDEEIAGALAAASDFSGSEELHAVVFTTLMAPDFLYRFENRGREQDGVVNLTAYELASRLSYHFWGGPPDERLLEAAASGALETEEGYADEVERLYADPRTTASIHRFFEEWLHLERGELVSSPRLDALYDGATDGLAQAMHDEVLALIDHELSTGGDWRDVLTSNESFASDPRLADLYGVEPWDGEGEPPTFPEGERSGLLTRAGMLVSADGSTNPFRRGVLVRRAILCDHVNPPPGELPADALTPPDVRPGQTTRDVFEDKVAEEPCASCHAQFSPLGYALEAYDGLGRFRMDEHLITATGEDLGFAAVDADVLPAVDDDDASRVSGPVELSARIAESDKANQCLARHYFRFTYRRFEAEADGCTLLGWSEALEDGATLADALRTVALDPVFRQRRLDEEGE